MSVEIQDVLAGHIYAYSQSHRMNRAQRKTVRKMKELIAADQAV